MSETENEPPAATDPAGGARPLSLIALLLVALAGGALAGLVGACFIWLVDTLTDLVWTTAPKALGVQPYKSWWLFAIPVVGGVLVGLGQMFLGNQPEPIEKNVARWRSGGEVPPKTIPATAVNSLVALVSGGPVGFEAALTGLLGGVAALISHRLGAARRLVRQAWGGERMDHLPGAVRSLPSWLAALAGLMVYRWLPFGQIDFGFRFDGSDITIRPIDALFIFVIAAVVAVPIAWGLSVVRRAEEATLFRRSPVLIAVAAGVVFALLALVNPFVLFSGQQGIQHLAGVGIGQLLFLAVAKWLGLVIALLAGWRGGPIFPLFFATACISAVLGDLFGMPSDLAMIAGIAAVSVVFVRGKLVLAFILTLYAVPVPYAIPVLIAAAAAATALGVGAAIRILPPGQVLPAPAKSAGDEPAAGAA